MTRRIAVAEEAGSPASVNHHGPLGPGPIVRRGTTRTGTGEGAAEVAGVSRPLAGNGSGCPTPG